MFGYVQIRKPELKIKDYDTYHSFYCGLCHILYERFGIRGQVTLTYDMTFLVLLLSSYYESEVKTEKRRCIVHPVRTHLERYTKITEYGADMNVLLTYFHFVDDKQDENSIKAAGGIAVYRGAYLKIKDRYPLQCKRIVRSLRALREIEVRDSGSEEDLQEACDSFGRLMAALFSFDEKDPMLRVLKGLAYHLGCYIYLTDAWDDLADDIEKKRYNPLKTLYNKKRYDDKKVEDLLFDHAAKTAAYFEMLPCLQYQDILRNILYAGIWNKWDRKKHSSGQAGPTGEGDRKPNKGNQRG